jgi:WD40 repeat protein
MSTDHVIKAWDLRTNKCVQTITADDWPRSEVAQPVSMVFDESRKRLVTGGRRPFFWEQKLTVRDKSGHRSAVVKAVYNSSFFVVVSVDDSTHLNDSNLSGRLFIIQTCRTDVLMRPRTIRPWGSSGQLIIDACGGLKVADSVQQDVSSHGT